MGGYDKKAGIFSLTESKSRAWCRRPDAPRNNSIEYYAKQGWKSCLSTGTT
jgi:hypothetical protein